jgi:hypothetical protein
MLGTLPFCVQPLSLSFTRHSLHESQAFTQSAAGSTFGLLRQTVERAVGLGTNRQIQFALRFNF